MHTRIPWLLVCSLSFNNKKAIHFFPCCVQFFRCGFYFSYFRKKFLTSWSDLPDHQLGWSIGEKAVSEQGLQLVELKFDMNYIKDFLLQMKNKKSSYIEEDNSVNKNEKPVEELEEIGESKEEKNFPLRSWVKKVELPAFEGNDPLGWLARQEKFFEVQKIEPSDKLKLASSTWRVTDRRGKGVC